MYTYLIGWRELDTWYYGVRTANAEEPESDLWIRYFTSSKFVKALRESHGEPDVVRVHKRFNSREEAVEFEKKILTRMGVVKSDRWLNRTTGGSEGFHSGKYRTPEVYARISKNLKGRVFRSGYALSEETKSKIGQAHRGKVPSDETRRKWSEQRAGRTPWNKGKPISKEQSKKLSESGLKVKHTCPHCGSVGGNVMFRWHFDNCKHKVKNAESSSPIA